MKKDEFNEALDHIEPRIVEEFIKEKEKYANKRAKKQRSIRICAVAACLAIILGAVFAVPLFRPKVPVWEDAQYSAEEIAKIFPTYDSAFTKAYTEIYVEDNKYLYMREFPDTEYLEIYRYYSLSKPIDEKKFTEFFDPILQKLSNVLGYDIPNYDYDIHHYPLDSASYTFRHLGSYNYIGDYVIHMFQDEGEYEFTILRRENNPEMLFDGESFKLLRDMTDEEIITVISGIKYKLFDIFGESFEDIEIYREYSTALDSITIQLYTKNEHPLNLLFSQNPISDCITIKYEYSPYFFGENDYNSFHITSICYSKNRNDITKEYKYIADAKIITLNEAEELLYKGYVYGGHICDLCMEEQDKISFEEYDLVGIEYKLGKIDQLFVTIPFYVFYKKIKTLENGIMLYAKTYVPAIEVSGYEQYFESQKVNHREPITTEFVTTQSE